MSAYRDERHAIACAVGIDRLAKCSHASWQDQYRSGFAEELTSKPEETDQMTLIERLGQDAMTRTAIKRKVDHLAYLALVAKYGADETDRARAINELAETIESNAPAKLRRIFIWLWASQAFRRGLRSGIMEDAAHGKHRSTLYRWRKEITGKLNNLEKRAEGFAGDEVRERGLIAA